MEKEIVERKEQLFVDLNKYVPQIEWEFKEVKEINRYLNDGRNLGGYDVVFHGLHNESKDYCFILFDNGRDDVIEVGFNHFDNGDGKNKKYVRDWDSVNEFFNEFCIGFKERERKILNGEMITPNMIEFQSFGNYIMSKVEYSEGFLNLLFTDSYNGDSLKESIKDIFDSFETKYRDLMKKNNSKEVYEKLYKNKNGYFGTPDEMVKSYLNERFVGELEYWMEEFWKEVEESESTLMKDFN
jgi:hypothetical protein